MQGFIFYGVGIGIASGILFRSFFDISWPIILFLLLIALSSGFLWWIRKRDFRSPLFFTSLSIICFSLGVMRLNIQETAVSPLFPSVGERVTIEGIIVREPEVRERSMHLYVRDIATEEKILVIGDRFQAFNYGDRIRVVGELTVPEPFETEYGRTFNYPGYLRARGVEYMVTYPKVERIETGQGNWFLERLFSGKQKFMTSLESGLSEPSAGLSEGILLGAKRALGADLEEAFRSVGIIHIVVLSGYNVMIVAEAVMRLLSWAFRPRMRMLIGIGIIMSFAILVGLGATVVRASIMATLVLIARTVGRQYAVMRALILTGVGMILINPYLLAFDPGFQLSFLATLGLILIAPVIERRLIRVPTRLGIREFLTATLSTQIFILPFLVFLVGTFSVVSVIVNVLVLPMVPIAMFLSFIAGIAGLLSDFLGVLAAFPAYISLMYIVVVAEQFSRLSFASFSLPSFSFWIVCVTYLFIASTLIWLYKKQETQDSRLVQNQKTNFDDWTIEEEIETPAREEISRAGVRDTISVR